MVRMTDVGWQMLEKVAVLFNAQDRAELSAQCEALIRSGFQTRQLWPLAKASGENAEIAELQTHCVVLDEAQRHGWRNVLLLDAAIQFTQDENLLVETNQLLADLQQRQWHILLLSVRDDQLAMPGRLPEMDRLHAAGRAYAVNASYYAILQNAYRRALEHSASLDRTWTLLMEKAAGRGLASALPGFIHRATGRGRSSHFAL